MRERKQAWRERVYEEDMQRLRGFRPLDDEFMRCLFKDNKPLAQFVLRIITGKEDLVVLECHQQEDMKRLGGARSICLDVYATNSQNRKYDIEVQRAERGARPHRARYHSSVMDVENLRAGQEFEELPETYVIFITERDFYGQNRPVYPVERINLGTGEPFHDGAHILYVNAEYRDESEFGRLMHDFNCVDAADMSCALMAERTRYLKNNPEGVKEMSRIMDELREQTAYRNSEDIAWRMLEAEKLSLEEIAEYTGLTLQAVQELERERTA